MDGVGIYSQVINPYQTRHEIRNAMKFCDMLAMKVFAEYRDKKKAWAVYRAIFGLDRPPREW